MVAIRLHAPPADEFTRAPDDLFGDSSDDCDPKAASDAVDARVAELETLLDADDDPAALPPVGEESAVAVHNSDSSPPAAIDSPTTHAQATKLVRAKTRYLAASLVLSELEQKRDTIKARIKSQKEIVAELYREVVNEGGGGDEDEDDDGDEAWEGGDGDREGEANEPTLAATASTSPQQPVGGGNSSWASTPTDRIGLDTIKGMGAKKLTAIYEAAPTLGKLESLRADTYAGGLKQIQGVGQAMADAIEDVILKWLTENRDSEVLGFAGGGDSGDEGRVAQGDSSSGHGDAAALLSDETSNEPSRGGDAVPDADSSEAVPVGAVSDDIAAAFPQVDDGESQPPAEAAEVPPQPAVEPPKKTKRTKAIAAAQPERIFHPLDDRGDLSTRAALIRSRLIDGFYADTEATDAFNDGRDARRNDLAIADACNWMPGERQDHWLLGWAAADLELSGASQQTVGA